MATSTSRIIARAASSGIPDPTKVKHGGSDGSDGPIIIEAPENTSSGSNGQSGTNQGGNGQPDNKPEGNKPENHNKDYMGTNSKGRTGETAESYHNPKPAEPSHPTGYIGYIGPQGEPPKKEEEPEPVQKKKSSVGYGKEEIFNTDNTTQSSTKIFRELSEKDIGKLEKAMLNAGVSEDELPEVIEEFQGVQDYIKYADRSKRPSDRRLADMMLKQFTSKFDNWYDVENGVNNEFKKENARAKMEASGIKLSDENFESLFKEGRF